MVEPDCIKIWNFDRPQVTEACAFGIFSFQKVCQVHSGETMVTPVAQHVFRQYSSRSSTKNVLQASILTARIFFNVMSSSLGPRGMYKMIVDELGSMTITSVGANILKEIDAENPVAKMLVEMAQTQDAEVGDGTISVILLASQLLDQSDKLTDAGIHPKVISEGFIKASRIALKHLEKIAVKVDPNDKSWLRKIAETSLSSKLVASYKEQIAELAVNAILSIRKGGYYGIDIDDAKIIKIQGGTLRETSLIEGIVLNEKIVHPSMPRSIKKAKIALMDYPLEFEKTRFRGEAEIDISSAKQMEIFPKEEEKVVEDVVNKVADSGANVLICGKSIGHLAQQYLADMGILALQRVKKDDLERLAKAVRGRIVSSPENLTPEDLGEAMIVEEKEIGGDRYIFVRGCKDPKSITIAVRGSSEKVLDEADRAIHKALSALKTVLIKPAVLAGGGASEFEISLRIEEWAEQLTGEEQIIAKSFARALLEAIPLVLAKNAGLNIIDIEAKLRGAHKAGKKWIGVDVVNRTIGNMMEIGVVEPLAVKEQMIKSAVETASMILCIDDVISRKKKEGLPNPPEEGAD
jgi:thermosome